MEIPRVKNKKENSNSKKAEVLSNIMDTDSDTDLGKALEIVSIDKYVRYMTYNG